MSTAGAEVVDGVRRAHRAPDVAKLSAENVAKLSAEIQALTSVAAEDAEEALALYDALRSAGDQLAAACALLLATVEESGCWRASGSARTFAEWLARRGRTSVGSARRDVTLGKALQGALPGTRDAMQGGRISIEHARVIAEHADTEARREALSFCQAIPDTFRAGIGAGGGVSGRFSTVAVVC